VRVQECAEFSTQPDAVPEGAPEEMHAKHVPNNALIPVARISNEKSYFQVCIASVQDALRNAGRVVPAVPEEEEDMILRIPVNIFENAKAALC